MLLSKENSFLIGAGIMLFVGLIAIIYCFYQRVKGLVHNYDIVNHELDDEEIEFKRMIEEQGDDFETGYGEEEGDGDEGDVTLDMKDRSRLEMLEQYRAQLVSVPRNNLAEVSSTTKS